MNELINLFQSFAFPVAFCIILLYFIVYLIKRELKQNDSTDVQVNAANERFINYLQENNSKLSNIITENTKAFNSLIAIITDVEKYLNSIRKNDR